MSPSTGSTRRTFLRNGLTLAGVAGLGPLLSACSVPFIGGDSEISELPVEGPEEALQRLMEGNERFVAGKTKPINESLIRREKVVKRQRPFASVFSCVDSRVPPELIFDRGLGDLFVVRTAGEVPDSAVVGSLEYGAWELEIPLLMVLGHKGCGAVKATIETMESGGTPEGSIGYLVDKLRPAVENAKAGKFSTPKAPTPAATDAEAEPGGEDAEAEPGGEDAEAEPGGEDAEAAAEDEVAPQDTAPGDAESSEADAASADAVTDTTLSADEDAAAIAEEDAAADAEATDAAAAASEEEALAEEVVGEDGQPVATKEPDLLTLAIIENVALTVEALNKSPIIADRVKKDRLLIVGGVYDLETGKVELTVNVPEGFGAPKPGTVADTTVPV